MLVLAATMTVTTARPSITTWAFTIRGRSITDGGGVENTWGGHPFTATAVTVAIGIEATITPGVVGLGGLVADPVPIVRRRPHAPFHLSRVTRAAVGFEVAASMAAAPAEADTVREAPGPSHMASFQPRRNSHPFTG